MSDFKSEVRDGMRIDWDVPVEMNDGAIMRCDVFRPVEEGTLPRHSRLRSLWKAAALRRRLSRSVEPDG